MPLGLFSYEGGPSMDKETMRMKLVYWSGIIKEANSSGMKISRWCEMNQISHRKYYYWHKKVMHDTYTNAVETGLMPASTDNTPQATLPAVPEFAELAMADGDIGPRHRKDPEISIRYGDFMINVDAEFSERELEKVLRVVSHVK